MSIPLNEIYVMLPAFNEEEVIAPVIRKIKQQGFEHVVVIDDGSSDNTAHVAKQAGAQLIQHMVNRGAGAACQTGIEMARYKGWTYVVFMDSDGQHYPDDLISLKEKMESTDCDLVIGSRFLMKNSSMPPTRIVFNGIANVLTNTFCKNRYSDSQSGLRMLNRKAIEKIGLRIDGFGYCSEMLIVAERAKLDIQETPIKVNYSTYSISKGQDFHIGINTALNFLWNTIFK